MRDEAATAPARAVLPQGYTFTSVESLAEITEAIRQLHLAGSGQIALVTIRLLYEERDRRAKDRPGEPAHQGAATLLQRIRSLLRKTDSVFLHQHSLYFALPGADLQGAEIVENRLWDALLCLVQTMEELEDTRPAELIIGHAAFPDPHANLEELLRMADVVSKHFAVRAEQTWQRDPDVREEEAHQEEEELPLRARKLGIPYLALLPRKLPQRVLHLVNARLAQELHCYPVGRERNMLTVAMLNPQDHKALERLRQETGLRIFPVLTHPEALESALEQLN